MTEKIFTNCFLVRRDGERISEVCLGMKKRGFGNGLWNGAGGKPDVGETLDGAAKREVGEEFGVEVTKMEKRGEFHFVLKQEEMEAIMHAFLVSEWEGEPTETEEMAPRWFKVEEVPYGEMWKSDREFLPRLFAGEKIRGHYVFEKEGGEVLESEVKVVEEF
ncbi:MAG: 8-oxo-dGTP diphosphatase [Candidatus Shapirobacteria bacterium]